MPQLIASAGLPDTWKVDAQSNLQSNTTSRGRPIFLDFLLFWVWGGGAVRPRSIAAPPQNALKTRRLSVVAGCVVRVFDIFCKAGEFSRLFYQRALGTFVHREIALICELVLKATTTVRAPRGFF